MQRCTILAFFLSLALVVGGCTTQSDQETGYSVLFEGTPHLDQKAIVQYGTVVGTIQATEVGIGRVTRIRVHLQPEFVQSVGDNLAFYVVAGHLEATTLQNLGHPLEKGALLCGFSSKSALNWFKLKTVLTDRIASAGRLAKALNQRLGSS